MPIEQALQGLTRMLAREETTNVVVVAHPDDGLIVQRLTLSDELATAFYRIARNAVIDTDDEVELLPYDAGFKLDSHQRFFLELDEHPAVREQLEQISAIQLAEQFAEDDEIIDSLRFYGIAISTTTQGDALFLRQYDRKRELTRKGGIAAVFGSGAYTRMEDNVFLFDSRIDCYAWQGFLIINNVAAFERIFNFIAELQAKADDTLDIILQRVPIANADAFRTACKGQIQMVAKLMQIASKPYFADISMESIQRTITDFRLQVEFRDVGGQPHMVFDQSLKTRWTILKLLDDNYLGSTMTNLKYEVNSKSALA